MRTLFSTLASSLVLVFAFQTASAQDRGWFEMLDDPSVNFYEVQQKAEAYFAEVGTGKGTGWKAYKRWEHHAQLQIDADGNFPDPAQRLAGIEEHLRNSTDRNYSTTSGNWSELGPFDRPLNGTGQPNGLGRLASIGFDASSSTTLYVGAASGGIWRSTNSGGSWTNITNNLPTLGVSSIVVHPTTSTTIYVGTGDRDAGDAPGYGVYYSTNGGTTWSSRNNGMGNRTVYEILMHPSNSSILIASTSGGIYRSTDAGANWTLETSAELFKDIAFKPGDPNYVYAASLNWGGAEFHRSTDNGQSWSQVTTGLPNNANRMALAVSADQPDYVYILAGNGTAFVGLYRSTNSGTSFTTRSTTPNILNWSTTGAGTGSQSWYDLVLLADPTDADVLYTGGINIWKSTNGGTGWSLSAHWTFTGAADDVHADHHVLEYQTATDNIYVGTDGGIYVTSDDGATYTDLSDDLAIAQIYKIGQSALTRDHVINGYQDNGTGLLRPTGWYTEIGGDGMECIIDPTDDNYMYGALYYGDIRRSDDGGSTFSGNIGPTGGSGGWVTPYKLDPNNASRMLVGRYQVYRTNDVKAATPTWTAISSFSGSSTLVDIAVAPSNSDVVYVSRNGTNNLYRSDNATGGSPTWTNLESNLPAAGVPRDIEVDPSSSSTVWIALGNNVYRSTNSGVSWTTVSSGLPASTAVYCLARDEHGQPGAIYAGLATGVYYMQTSMSSWINYSNGFPLVEVRELEFHHDLNSHAYSRIRAATYGRGLWESDLYSPSGIAPVADFDASQNIVCVGATVNFTDKSSYGPTGWSWSFTPATVTYTGGTNSSSQNPQVIFNAAGNYSVTLTVTNATGNDNEVKTTFITAGTAVSLPANEDFEGTATCATTSNCETTNCTITSSSWSNVANGTYDDIDWRTDEGGTPSSSTGPSVDYNPGTAAGNYIYTEATVCFGREAILLSDCIDLSTYATSSVTFAYHMYANPSTFVYIDVMGALHLDVFASGTWTNSVWSRSGNQGNSWNTATVDLSSYAGDIIQLRFRGVTGPNYGSDIALDDISITASGVLAVNDVSLSGEHMPGLGNAVNWTVNSASQLKSFIVQRMSAGGSFTDISPEIEKSSRNSFQFIDDGYVQSTSYYRLRLVEHDGSTSFSKTVAVTAERGISSFTVKPNPFSDELVIRFDEILPGELTLVGIAGEEFMRLTPTELESIISTEDLSAGIYFIRWHDEVVKVVKGF